MLLFGGPQSEMHLPTDIYREFFRWFLDAVNARFVQKRSRNSILGYILTNFLMAFTGEKSGGNTGRLTSEGAALRLVDDIN